MRSLSCTAHGTFDAAWHYHPFGPVWLAVATIGATVRLLPGRLQRPLRAVVNRHSIAVGSAYASLVAAFSAYGLARVLCVFCFGGSEQQ